MEDNNFDKFLTQRLAVQREINSCQKRMSNMEIFKKTSEERKQLKKAKTQYRNEMYGLFGQNWRKLSRCLSCLNAPTDTGIRMVIQKNAQKKNFN